MQCKTAASLSEKSPFYLILPPMIDTGDFRPQNSHSDDAAVRRSVECYVMAVTFTSTI